MKTPGQIAKEAFSREATYTAAWEAAVIAAHTKEIAAWLDVRVYSRDGLAAEFRARFAPKEPK